MKIYLSENPAAAGKTVALDDMLLTKALPSTAGSKMLDGYMSLFDAAVVEKLQSAGYSISGKVNVGEFAADFLGETSYEGACTDENGNISAAAAEALKCGRVAAVIGLDCNGTSLRAAALSGQVALKPTYGTISRYGTIPVACSGETVSVNACKVDDLRAVLDVIAGHDDRDGTSLPEDKCALLRSGAPRDAVKTVGIAASLVASADEAVQKRIADFADFLKGKGIAVTEIDDSLLKYARTAWNILFSAELCNNVSRYDGVKYGYRTPNYKTIGELYTNSRTEAFGEWLMTVILYGSEVLATDNYGPMYDKALRVRRVLADRFAEIFASCDALLMPVCGRIAYTPADVAAIKDAPFAENLYTAPASITGLPAVAVGGVQLMGKAFSDNALLDLAALCGKEA